MRAEIKDGVCRIYDVTPQAIKAEPQGAAAAAVIQSIQYVEQRIETVAADKPTPQEIGAIPASERGKPWGVADLGGDGKLWIHHRPPPPTPQEIGADLAGSAAAARAEAIAFTQARLAEVQAQLDLLYPTTALVLWGYGRVLAGAPFGLGGVSTNVFLNRYAIQSPSASGDEVEVSFLLKSGDYRLDLWGMRNNQQAVFQLFLNGVQLGSDIDRYAASASVMISSFNVSFAATKIQKVRTKVIGRNPSSVGFQVWNSAICIYPL